MTFTLYVDEPRWRAHLQQVLVSIPGLVPVMKGNGYGLGNARLAKEAGALGVDTVAVGTADEVAEVREHFAGDVLVMAPSYPRTFDDLYTAYAAWTDGFDDESSDKLFAANAERVYRC